MSTISIIKKGGFWGDHMKEKEMDPTGITRIVKISFYYRHEICGLKVYFEHNGTTQCTGLWGSTGVNLTEVILETNEYITSVNGHVASFISSDICYVESLGLKTNLKVYGPYGSENGESFEYTAPLGGQIIGFHAYYTKNLWDHALGVYIHALGVYIRQSNGTIIKEGPFLGRGWIVRHMHPTGITRIVKISIYHSDKIDGLTVYFECNGITQCTDRWGGDGGKLTEINLKAIEYIKSVKGYQDNNILKSLVLETNLNIYGPYGKEEGESFEHTSPIRCQIIGFFAGVGINYVSRVGVYVGHQQVFISKSVLCGGSGGSTRDMEHMSAVSGIDEVSIRHGDTIDALSVRYKFHDDPTESTPIWGGQRGTLTKIDLDQYEYIEAVRGYVGYFGDIFIVRSLQLITNKKSYGPYGKEEGTPFELSAFDGQIIGFHGRSGAYLDAIGVYVQWPEEEEDENKYYLQCSEEEEEEEEEDKNYLEMSEEEEGR